VGEDADAELEQRGVREPAMLREMTLTLSSQRREIVHDVTAPQGIEFSEDVENPSISGLIAAAAGVTSACKTRGKSPRK
jgi:hypothetical protein